MALADEVRARRGALGLSQKALAERAGVSQQLVGSIETGATRTTKFLPEIARALGCSLADLDERMAFDPAAFPPGAMPLTPGPGIPVLGRTAAGVWLDADAFDAPLREDSTAAFDRRWPAEAQYALVNEGTSMNMIIGDGDLLHCVDVDSGGVNLAHRDIVVVERRNHDGQVETTVKRYLQLDGKVELRAESVDPRWKDLVIVVSREALIEAREVRVKALVIRALREFARWGR